MRTREGAGPELTGPGQHAPPRHHAFIKCPSAPHEPLATGGRNCTRRAVAGARAGPPVSATRLLARQGW
eukprot:11325402-Alexandrium_andersonii.AAC.1